MASRSQHASTFVEAFSLLRLAAKRTATWTLVLDVVGAVGNAVLLGIAGRLLGLLADDATWPETMPWLAGATVALAVTMVSSSLHHDLTSLATEQVEAHAVGEVLHAASLVPYASFDSADFYDRLRRAHESGKVHAWSIVQSTLSLVRGALDIGAIIVLLFFVAPILIPISVAAYVPLWFVSVLNNRVLYRFSWDETEADRRRSYIESLLGDRGSAKEVRAFALADELVGRYRSLWQERLARLARVIRASALRSAAGSFASSVVVATALGFVVWLTIRGDLTLDEAGVGVIGVRQLSNGVARTTRNVESLHRSATFLGDYRAFHEEAGRLAETPHRKDSPRSIDVITVEGLGFTYEGASAPALDGIDMTIRAGEVTAIVGANGSGKTTLLMLLAGLYEPTSGVVRWDGEDCAQLSPLARRQAVAPLFQDFVQYHFTARENVVLTEPDDDRTTWALEMAEAWDAVSRLADGLDTQLGKDFEGGAELSIGEWQRLALARSLYQDGPLLLLDEPASALDPPSEARLVGRLRSACADRCVVMVSHRFASVRQADVIYVLDEGRVIEHGSHRDLLARGAAYSALYRAQTGPSGR